jgi:DNA-binding LytR/AlgR family response regulator
MQKKQNYRFYNNEKNKQSIDSESVLYLKCIKDYVIIFLKDGTEIVERKLLKKFEKELLEYNFVRISHNTIVNSNFVTKLEPQTMPEKLFLDDIELKITRRRRNFVKKRIPM